tara:strand:- start:429 stop:599 length:171 start_codon:yes stop_codon:yes gene_type:complete
MIINSARYMIDFDGNNNAVHADIGGVMMSIPMDTANRHYAAILEWVADGNTIAAAD